ncbi:MAG TPA: hypothetical protein VFE36_07720 [Candidatus Baltobacteraceae bacterium]|nr:hypothetical protein [Candidatus Baltobacteraceae bacterium]
MAELERIRLLNGVSAKDARVVAFWAPAGFGKSTVARQFARRYFHSRVVDASGVASDGEFAWRVVCALEGRPAPGGLEYDGRDSAWIERARRAWRKPFAGVVSFENSERLTQIHGGEQFLRDLLATTPHPRTIVCCGRAPLDLGFARFALPHETYVFTGSDLAFDCEEVRGILDCSDRHAAIVWDVTRGWPLCALMIARVARERPLEDVCSRLESASFDSLYDYLLEHIFEVIPEDSRSCSIAIAAIPRCTHQDIVKLYGLSADSLRQRALTSGLIAIRDGAYELHPLVRASMLRRYPDVARERLHSAAEAWRAEDPERAALLYVDAGEPNEAASVLESLVTDRLLVAVPQTVHGICRRIPRSVLLNFPRLWSHTMIEQPYVGLEERLREALSVWERLTASESPRTRFLVLGVLMHALLGLGRLEDSQEYYDRYLAAAPENDEEIRPLKSAWRVALACKAGNYLAARAAFECERAALKRYAGVYAIAMADVDFACARAVAHWPDERMHQDIALHYARESENPSAMEAVLIECIFGAWLAADGTQMRRHTVELDALRPPGHAFVRACRLGSIDELDAEVERPKTRAYACLIAASVAPRTRRAALAQLAVSAADAAGDPLLRVVTCVAASMIDPARRDVWLDRAAPIASGVDAAALPEAVEMLRGGKVPGGFAGLAGYFSEGAAEPQQYRLVIATQSLFRGQERVALTNREMELLCYLGMRGLTTSIHELAEAMVPQKDSASAGRMLRVLIARVRKRCDRGIVVHEDNGYRLGSHVTVACKEILRRFALLRNDRLSQEEGAALRRDLGDLRLWSQGIAPAWEWARELEDYVRAMEIKLATRLEAARVAS